MSSASNDTIRKRGERARARAQARAGSGRVTSQDWAPEIAAFEEFGMSVPEMARALGMSDRRIRQIRAEMNDDGSYVNVVPLPKREDALEPRHREMLHFSADAFEDFYNEFSGRSLLPLHKQWVDDFIHNRNLLINIAPRHGKSHIFSVWVPIWLVTMDRNHQILVCSAGGDLLKKLLFELFFHLQSNNALIEAFGRYMPEKGSNGVWRPASGEAIVVGRTMETKSGQFSIQVRGAGQNILGSEATVVIVDDCTDGRVSRSATERVNRMNWLREEVFSRVEPTEDATANGRVVVVGQRVHIRDLYGELAEQKINRGPRRGEKAWKHIQYPAILRWPDEDPNEPEALVLWPEKWDYEQLMYKYEDMGESAFMCMYQQEPLPEGSAFVRQEWWEGCKDFDRPGGQGYQQPEDEDATYLPMVRVLSIDPSPTQWNALTVADVITSRDAYAVATIEFKRWKGGSRELQAEIDRVIATYEPMYLILESSTMTKWFEGEPYFQNLQSRIIVIPHQTGKNKGDPEWGVDSLAADIEAGKIRLPWGDANGREMSEMFMHEANVYGHGFEFDLLMSMWFIKWNYRKLIPRRNASRGFTRKQPQSWGYLKQARKQQAQDPAVKEWRSRHGRHVAV